ncbi:tetratricopeptide repeat protein [Pseudodesulfovibrio sp. zrk46]|uniref:tetratricopeptide repeat protein n=1 Tax=Pseudodesulfovibrio sp. zrk46 TaxID=2725288 RepID=UPI001FFD7B09|nr:tetratricopeptide repeat protein [Pseudodesulfovibrio sp. zrk46]
MMLDSLRYGIFSNNSHNISLDRRCLIGLGAKDICVYPSWTEAEAGFQLRDIDFALVDEKLEDTDAIQCIDRLKRVSSRNVPVVIITNDRRREAVLDSIAVGCGGYVLRPYSIDTLSRHLRAASSSISPDEIEQEMLSDALGLVSAGQFDEALESLEELVEEENPATKYFERGMRYLAEEKYGKAIIAFNKVIAINEMYAEAYKGMAEAHKGKGDMEKYQEYLTKAGDVFAIQDRLDEAKQVFVEILQNEPDAVNPFNRLGVKLRKQGDYKGAIRAYHQAAELTPDDPNLYYNMARAYGFNGDNENALKYAEKSIELDPKMEHAQALRDQIAKKSKNVIDKAPKTDMSGRVLIDLDN